MDARGFDPGEWAVKEVFLEWFDPSGRRKRAAEAACPGVSSGGRTGWLADFHDVEVPPGVNGRHPGADARAEAARRARREFCVEFLVEAPEEVGSGPGSGRVEPSVEVGLQPFDMRSGTARVRVGVDWPAAR